MITIPYNVSNSTESDLSGVITLLRENGLYDAVRKTYHHGSRLTLDTLSPTESFENSLQVFSDAALALRKEIGVVSLEERLASHEVQTDEGRTQLREAIYFSNSLALAIAGYTGLQNLGIAPIETTNVYAFGEKGKTTNREGMQKDLVVVTKKQIMQVNGEHTLSEVLSGEYVSWIQQFNWDNLKDIAKRHQIETQTIQVGPYTFKEGVFHAQSSQIEVDERIMNVGVDDLIGNETYVKQIRDVVINLLSYDSLRKKNPNEVPGSIFTYGDPGCGKTFTAHAVMREAQRLAEKYQKPLKLLVHNPADYASHYQNKSMIALEELSTTIRNFNGAVIMYAADVDTVFGKRDGRQSQEEQKVQQAYFRMFDGTSIPKRGQFLVLADANYVDGIDEATKSRIFDLPLILERFKTPEEFTQYAKMSLTRKAPSICVNTSGWDLIGKLLFESGLNNRVITNQFQTILSAANVSQETDLALSFDELVERKADRYAQITADQIITHFENSLQAIKEMEEHSVKKKALDEMQRFKTALGLSANTAPSEAE